MRNRRFALSRKLLGSLLNRFRAPERAGHESSIMSLYLQISGTASLLYPTLFCIEKKHEWIADLRRFRGFTLTDGSCCTRVTHLHLYTVRLIKAILTIDGLIYVNFCYFCLTFLSANSTKILVRTKIIPSIVRFAFASHSLY